MVLLRIREIQQIAEPLRIAVLETIPEDPELQAQWNALVLRLDDPQVFYTYEWSLAVQRAYLATLRPLVFLLYDEGPNITGIVSLALDADRTQASFLCAATGDYCDFITRPEHKNFFVSSVLSYLQQHGVEKITLTNLPSDSSTVAAIQQSSGDAGYHYFGRTAYICAQVLLNRIERRPDGKLALPGRKMVRRSLSAMRGESPVRLEHSRESGDIAALLPEFIQAHIARFTATGRCSNLAQPERQLFLIELSRLLATSGWVSLTQMITGKRVLAWNFGFRFQGSLFWYQPTFDTAVEQYSPGFCLLSMLVEEAVADPELRVVDLGLGAEGYKERFANQTRKTLYVTLRNSYAAHIREVSRYYAAQAIKSSPVLEKSARRVMSIFRSTGDGIHR